MYERFTQRARKVMQLASQEAQRFNHEYIGTEHVLLGLVKEGSGVGANVLKALGVDLQGICAEVEKLVQSGPESAAKGKLPMTPRAKQVIESAVAESRRLNHNYVGTEHLLLGLVRVEEGVAARVLANLGLRLEHVRAEVLMMLGHGADAVLSSSMEEPQDPLARALSEVATSPAKAPTQSPPHPGELPFDPTQITRPDRALMRYYVIISLLTGPAFPITLLPLLFKYETLKYRFDESGVSMSWGVLWRREIYLTYRRIQDIHLTRNIIQRWMGLATVALALAVLPDVVAYIAIHLRYDATWYVMTERSLRIRRGIWVIHETTITFENVQNVLVRQGPIQRLFGIANVLVETAGGGGDSSQGAHGGRSLAAHRGLIEGIADPQRIRDLVLARLRRSRSAGLGDEPFAAAEAAPAWRSEHLAALKDIRDCILALNEVARFRE